MVAIRNVFYYAVACQIAIFVNSATVIKVSNQARNQNFLGAAEDS